MTRELHLFALTSPGGAGGTRAAEGALSGTAALVDAVVDAAKAAEDAAFDAILIADFVAGPSAAGEWQRRSPSFIDPTVLTGVVAQQTSSIGIVPTISTTWEHPYELARRLLSLDHISGGRIGWNVVTSMVDGAAHSHGLPALPPHAQRYARAREVVDVVNSLWDSFPDDTETDSVRTTEFHGQYVQSTAVLGLPRSPQGRLPIIQAGQSDDGLDFASAYADAVFVGKDNFEHTREVRNELVAGSRAAGRDRAPLAMSSLGYIIAQTREEALAIEAEVDRRTPLNARLDHITKYFEAGAWEIDKDNLDTPLPPFPEHTEHRQTGLEYYRRVAAERPDWTVREFLHRVRGGHFYSFLGTPSELADEIERWFVEGAADGFVVQPRGPRGPQWRLFIEQVLPVLRARGLFRTKYAGTTLREHLGLERPARTHLSTPQLVATP